MRYRKKPVVIEAVLWDGSQDSIEELAALTGQPGFAASSGAGIVIKTLEGDMVASPGDYIIKGVKGELYPCKPDIFRATYDLVR